MVGKKRRRRNRKQTQGKVGGIAFFMSLSMLLFLGSYNLLVLPGLWDNESSNNFWRFFCGGLIGAAVASLTITGHTHVLLHELKHALVSNLVGNKWKGMKVKKDTGHFQYSYTKATSEYNAFISLAPYFLPLFTLPLLILSLAVWWKNHQIVVLITGIGYGIDLILNTRDLSPIQTDLTEITGGFSVAILYVLGMNLTISTILIAWVLKDLIGLQVLLYGLWQFCLHLVAYYRGL